MKKKVRMKKVIKHLKNTLMKHIIFKIKAMKKTLLVREHTNIYISSPHDNEGLVSFGPQNSEVDDVFCYDFKRDDLEENPLTNERLENIIASPFNEGRGSQGYVVKDMHFHKFGHELDGDYW
jgi:hypothetical protein